MDVKEERKREGGKSSGIYRWSTLHIAVIYLLVQQKHIVATVLERADDEVLHHGGRFQSLVTAGLSVKLGRV